MTGGLFNQLPILVSGYGGAEVEIRLLQPHT